MSASQQTLERSNKRLLKVLEKSVVERPPIWLMRQAGRYLPEYREVRKGAGSFLELCYNPKLAAEVTLQPLRRFNLDAAILFADILLIPDALGQKVSFQEGEGPVLECISSEAELAALSLDNISGHLAPVFETLDRLKSELPDHVALIGFAGSPWTVATYMVGGRGSPDQRAARIWAARDPAGFQSLINLVVDATVIYLREQVDAGAEVLQLFDSWAANMPTAEFERWVIAPTKQIVAALGKSHPGVPIIGFPRGAGPAIPGYIQGTGVAAVGLDTGVPRDWAVEHVQPLCPVQGNLDPFALVAGGEALEREARAILESFKGGGHIFNLGHGIVPETPPEHVADLVDLVTSWQG